MGNQCQRETACLHWTGATTEKRQVSLGINEPAGEKAGRGEDHERSSEFQKEQKDIWRLKEETREEGEKGGKQGRQQMKKTPLEMVWGECVGSLLLGNECAAVEVSVYFCRLSFQGPDWQLFLEPESHSLLNRLRREEREGGGHIHAHTLTPNPYIHTRMDTRCCA